MTTKALVLFSGGQDSTVCLAWALSKFDHVETIGFDYGQRHRIELRKRRNVNNHLLALVRHLGGKPGQTLRSLRLRQCLWQDQHV